MSRTGQSGERGRGLFQGGKDDHPNLSDPPRGNHAQR